MRTFLILTASALLLASPQVGHAADDSGDNVKCKAGLVFNPDTRKCEQATNASPENVLIQQGWDLADAGDYDAAIAVLWRVDNWRTNARALNYLGFAHRKSGKLDEAFSYYRLALQADPDYTLARAYLGEGYLAINRLDLAEAELAEIAVRAGTDAYEYKELAGHIAAYKAT